MADHRASHVVLSVGCLKKIGHSGRSASSTPNHAMFGGGYNSNSNSNSNSYGNVSRMNSPLQPPPSEPRSIMSSISGPFHGLIICVTGLSRDARKQVQEATVWMGGEYSPDLHSQCTHLVVQSFSGRKYEHALKHGLKRGLYVVTLAWFVNCVKQNVRLDESLYNVRSFLNTSAPIREVGSSDRLSLPSTPHNEMKALTLTTVQVPTEIVKKDVVTHGIFSNMCFCIDMDSSNEFQRKVMEVVASEGGSFIDHWYIGSPATHIVCEGAFMLKYLGFNVNLVTPFWVMKSVKERNVQRLVQLSADLARHVSVLLDIAEGHHSVEGIEKSHEKMPSLCGPIDDRDLESRTRQREEKSSAAKASVRRRRGPHNQPCRSLPRLITPNSLLEDVSWSITEPSCGAHVYVDRCGSESDMPNEGGLLYNIQEDVEDRSNHEGAFYTRPLTERERGEIIFKGVFVTILFPIDRFSEIGPSSRTFYNANGFCRRDILEYIWSFYQECMTPEEVEVALYTDSRHADKLRGAYVSKEALTLGHVPMRRYEFLGSRKSFEGLKRIGSDNTGHIYELFLTA